MTKTKLIRLKQIISRINHPVLKRFDRIQEAARQPDMDLQSFLEVCLANDLDLREMVSAEKVNETGLRLMQACRLSKINPSDYLPIANRF